MKPAYVVLHIYKGQTFRDKVILQAPDGTPIDLPALYDAAFTLVVGFATSPTSVMIRIEHPVYH